MSKPYDLSKPLVALDHDSTLVCVIEMSGRPSNFGTRFFTSRANTINPYITRVFPDCQLSLNERFERLPPVTAHHGRV
jgi:hypothetical protein